MSEERVGSELDPELQLIVWLLDRNPKISFGLTLTVGGSLVSGSAVGRSAFWKIQAEQDPENRSGLRDYFMEMADAAVEDAVSGGGLTAVGYVHLVDSAHWLSASGTLPTDQRAFWRGRLSEVEGWTLGQLGTPPSPALPAEYADLLGALQQRVDQRLAENDQSGELADLKNESEAS